MAFVNYLKQSTVKAINVLTYVVQYGCIMHVTVEHVADFVVCSGPSMEPTIFSNNILLSEHITPRLQQIKKGDIVISRSPTNPRQHICKRVTGLPGDRKLMGFSCKVVPPGHVWLEGDNRNNSTDSRNYGPVPYGLIRGRAVCKVWPPSEICMLTNRGKCELSE
ncbi:mitochondrial inner membrane protease subunit 1-like isoform X4 [Schistocerca americana]|uniref:mitochondrial inner membrane protease subunit 1-like isoform X4 n=1 Tax=Schistocerca americana TaxID=7009 RepID=UPI001F4F56B7|nr:mitochondrial inner membrane protease subunit 1-like isoform X4 [Schistocerca americana]XP_047120845.1 mitochondrial inner membrane protease subunit 1-like isoform X5 [Schistocerca piceifrons]XP_049765112.1 mitochondrial inner membrane protease subunit 1-like isoform X3 [Schistocerca cancellata]XP_049837820.1 mitochondrial inner membrane protease subunit 1-like isoform X2 [Schistocerca gregaria]XP_049937939.1 mitochondrial inner membrane protease subunit 1-like isoform X4 [Schistocerca seria